MPAWGFTVILIGIAVAAIFLLRYLTKRIQKKHDAQQEQIDSYKQT